MPVANIAEAVLVDQISLRPGHEVSAGNFDKEVPNTCLNVPIEERYVGSIVVAKVHRRVVEAGWIQDPILLKAERRGIERRHLDLSAISKRNRRARLSDFRECASQWIGMWDGSIGWGDPRDTGWSR